MSELNLEATVDAEHLRQRFWEACPDLLAAIPVSDGHPRLINERAWLQTLGYSAQEIMAVRLVDLVHPEDRERTLNLKPLMATGEQVVAFENRYRRKDGSWVWLSWNAVREGEINYCIARDVTVEKEAQAKLAQSERQVRLMIASVIDYALFMLNPDGTVANWNSGAERIKGYTSAEIVGRHLSTFYTEEDRAAGLPQRALETARREGRYEAEAWRVRKSGEPFWASVVIDAVRDEQGELIGFAKITRDFTERRRAQLELQYAHEQLAQSQKMEAIGQLTGGIAHDFNNLLAVIAGGLKLIQKTDDPARLAMIKDSMQQAVDRGARLTRQLLAFARRQEEVQTEVVDPVELVESMRELLARSLGEDVEIGIFTPQQPWMVAVDRGQLELVLLNLSVNSRDAMPDGGRLDIAVENIMRGDGKESVRITVADTGTGMSAEIAARAFEPFFTTKEVGKGSGLGLAQVYGFARQAGGRAWIDTAPGEGTAIRIELPRCHDEAPAPGRAPAGDDDQRTGERVRGRVLLVEDDDNVAGMVRQVLEEGGVLCQRAANAREALNELERGEFGVVLSDIVMPGGMNGVELARVVRERWPGLPVILTTGYTGKSDFEPSEFPVLLKPYDPELMLATVRDALRVPEPAGDA